MTENKKSHWEHVYEVKQPNEVSWTQEVPITSINLLMKTGLSKDAAVIDIGGGDSKFVDFLLSEGYTNITVLDISENAVKRAQKRLGAQAENVCWIVSDITEYRPDKQFDFWHDRAAFHFLTSETDIQDYSSTVRNFVAGFLAMGTFSENGPKKCSGLDIRQYSQSELSGRFNENFETIDCFNEDHRTPFDTVQNFTFCLLKKIC